MQAIKEAPARMGITLESSSPIGGVDDDWPHISYQCRISRNGREVWSGPYKLGIGHVQIPKPPTIGSPAWMMRLRLSAEEDSMLYAMNTRPHAQFKDKKPQARLCAKLAIAQKVSPRLTDVLHSLLMDSTAHGQTFESWCSELGYDADSRKAERIYDACVETGRKLARAFTPAELDELREAFSEY